MSRAAGARSERRAGPRAPTRLEVAYEDADRQVFLTASDVSEEGVFLLAPDPPPVGATARLVLELPGHPAMLRLQGVVARREEAGSRRGFALRFDGAALSVVARRALREFILHTLAPTADGVG